MLHRVFGFIEEYWSHLCANLGAVMLALAGVMMSADDHHRHDGKTWITFGIGAAVYTGGEIARWKRARRIAELESNVRDLEDSAQQASSDYSSLWEMQLSTLLNDVLKLGDSERVSIYKHDGSSFVMLGRYSLSPALNRKGRGIYPDTQGVIAESWKTGEVSCTDIPDPGANLAAYIVYSRDKWNIPEETTNSLTMLSRSISAFPITDSTDSKRIAVIVFESTSPDGLNPDRIRASLKHGEAKRLTAFIERMRPQEPTPSSAWKVGY